MTARPLIALVAGESSGDQLGAGLIEAARQLRPDLEFVGIAGPAMRAAGCQAWYQTEALSVMGLAEVLRHLPRLARVRSGLMQRLLVERPAAFVGIDSPDFNLRVALRLRAAGIPTLQYVCPSVWAWRPRRTRLLARACDRVLCLLPFEVPFLEAARVPATFVGHPFADQIEADPDQAAARARLGLRAKTVVGLLPGSRVAEVARLGPLFIEAAERVRSELTDVAFVVPLASDRLRTLFEAQVAARAPALDLTLVDRRARDVIAASDGLLAASGTVTLEAMLSNRPMVVAYRFSPATYWLARSLNLVSVKYFSLPNLLAGERLVPELLQAEVTPAALAGELLDLLRSPSRINELRTRFSELRRELQCDASVAAARAVLGLARLC